MTNTYIYFLFQTQRNENDVRERFLRMVIRDVQSIIDRITRSNFGRNRGSAERFRHDISGELSYFTALLDALDASPITINVPVGIVEPRLSVVHDNVIGYFGTRRVGRNEGEGARVEAIVEEYMRPEQRRERDALPNLTESFVRLFGEEVEEGEGAVGGEEEAVRVGGEETRIVCSTPSDEDRFVDLGESEEAGIIFEMYGGGLRASILIQRFNAINDLFFCTICEDLIWPMYPQCINAHAICLKCVDLVRNCPQCRDNGAYYNNVLLARVCETLEFPCRYSGRGCTEYLPASRWYAHGEVCTHALPDRRPRGERPITPEL